MPKWSKVETQFVLEVVSFGGQELGLEAPKQRVVSFRLKREFIKETHTTQLTLGVVSLEWQ